MIVSSSQTRFQKGAKSASGVPGRKNIPRGSKSATFAQGLFRLFNRHKSIRIQSEVGGAKRSGAEAPTGNPSPAPSASAPHARHDRSMARSSSEARAICGLFSDTPPGSQKNVPSPWGVPSIISFILARFYNGFAVDQLSLCSARLMKIRFS